MDRAERRRRTARIVKRRRLYADGLLGYIIHPDELGFISTQEYDYDKELRKYQQFFNKVVGRSKVMHPFDCGRTRCGICSHKRWRLGLTLQEIRAELGFREQIKDYEGNIW